MLLGPKKYLHSVLATRSGYIIFWGLLYTLFILLASSAFLYKIPLPESNISITAADFSISDANEPDLVADGSWRKVDLPNHWRINAKDAENVWYQISLKLSVPPNRLWSILIPATKMNAAVYLNGELLGNGGRFSDPVARNWMTPLFYSIPNGLLKPGDNSIHVRVKSDPPGSGYLSALYLAPYPDLYASYEIHRSIRITLVQILTILLFVQSALIILLWFARRENLYYLYYSLAATLWALHNFNIFVVNIPVSTHLWDWFSSITLGGFSVFSALFIHQFLNLQKPRFDRFVVSAGIVASIILLFLQGDSFYFAVKYVWDPIILSLGFYTLVILAIRAWRTQHTELQLLTIAGIAFVLYGTHDLLVVFGVIDWGNGFYIQYSAAVILTLFGLILIRRFTYSLNQTESLNRDLELRVEQKHTQLELNYQKLRHLENEKVLIKERERLTLDMHDGMGGHLVSTLAMIEAGDASMTDVAEALRLSLDDLKHMIDSLNIDEDDLGAVLGMFRMRISTRLKHSKMTLVWDVGDIGVIPEFGPRQALQVLRILQEAFTNIIKYAKADHIRLSAQPVEDSKRPAIKIVVSDNGQGITENQSFGRGINNMHQRASDIGAELLLESSPEGTTISLVLPY